MKLTNHVHRARVRKVVMGVNLRSRISYNSLMNAPLRFWLLVLTIATIGLALRLYFAGEALWLDELHTAWCVDADFGDVASRARLGNQAPLFFWLTKLVTWVLNSTPLMLRLISVLCGTFAILGSAVFVYRQSPNTWAAVLTAFLVAMDQWLLFYSSEARPYAMIQVIALFQFVTFLSLMDLAETGSDRSNRLKHFLLAVSTFILLSTHLTSGLLMITEFFILLLVRPQQFKSILISIFAGCLIAIPVFFLSLGTFDNRSQWQSDSGLMELFGGWRNVLLLQLVPTIVVVSFCWFETSKTGEPNSRLRKRLLLVSAWAVIPLALAIVFDQISIPLASYRYTTVASLAGPICAGLAVAMIRHRQVAIAVALLLLFANVAFNPVAQAVLKDGQLPAFRNENWQSAVEYVNQISEGPELVFLMSNLYEDSRARNDDSERFRDYLKFPVGSVYPLEDKFEIVSLPTHASPLLTDAELEKCIANQGAIFICRVDNERLRQIRHDIEKTFDAHSQEVRIETKEQPGNILKVILVNFK